MCVCVCECECVLKHNSLLFHIKEFILYNSPLSTSNAAHPPKCGESIMHVYIVRAFF